MNSVYEEICFIVNARNEWARKRSSLRYKLMYAVDNRKPIEIINKLKREFEAHNKLRHDLNKHSFKLKRLLKQTNGKLISDRSAGYCQIRFYPEPYSTFSWSLDGARVVEREQIKMLAMNYLFRCAVEKQLNSNL